MALGRYSDGGPTDHHKLEDPTQNPWFLEFPLSWAFEPECRILVFQVCVVITMKASTSRSCAGILGCCSGA